MQNTFSYAQLKSSGSLIVLESRKRKCNHYYKLSGERHKFCEVLSIFNTKILEVCNQTVGREVYQFTFQSKAHGTVYIYLPTLSKEYTKRLGITIKL